VVDASDEAQNAILRGTGSRQIDFVYDDGLRSYKTTKTFEGVIPNLERRWKETDSAWAREEIERYMSATPARPATATASSPRRSRSRSAAATFRRSYRILDPQRGEMVRRGRGRILG
jgi:excinuclease UvrABC ATPase subunit